jgi:hypothetical protein
MLDPNQPDGLGLNRRQILGLGAAGAITGIGASALPQKAFAQQPDDLVPASGALVPPAQPGLSYLVLSGYDFTSREANRNRTIGNTGAYTDGLSVVCAPIHLPPGTIVKELTLSVLVTSAGAASFLRPHYQVVTVDRGLNNIGTDITFATSPDVQTKSSSIDRIIGHGQQHNIGVTLIGGTTAQIVAAMIGYVGPPVFVPIVPARVYDSRLDMSPDANGRLAAGSNRTISIADGRDVVTGAVDVPDAVPEAARAVAYNLTAAAPQAVGFLSITPGGAAETASSALNWGPTSPAVANAGIVGVDDDRRVKIFAGGPGSSTNFVVDITGYYI